MYIYYLFLANIFIISDAVTIPCLIEAARYNILSLRASMSLRFRLVVDMTDCFPE